MKWVKNNRGFTMIEILVVITMIGILSTIVVPKITSQMDKPKKSRAMIEIKTIKDALDIYFAENSSYPTTQKEIAEVMRDNGVLGEKFGKYSALDPWKNPYYIKITTNEYTIWSEGPKTGTELDDIVTTNEDTEVYVDKNNNLDPSTATTDSTKNGTISTEGS
ncbi:hypothetical protein Dred_1024 [Desulforamulus reducens MI-1]|uniref:Type II secretion system protein GspG C-terminal domain-containing protein n=1 Tax=Desulforamulus reducens (strain ATCC BAA-1160 / DSM 100696 / MI-1) TaxID=349161 RepID=A4J3A6_DESRM|nr:type II secretion system protein GspG [Desulforamulus reducens]ABO49559.1 hypothetical protein Dred_1024 [Desulforamulus reducens MI-1]